MTGLVIAQVSVARGGHTVVREVSITAPLGEVTAILGPNGAGKSTLALGVAGLLRTPLRGALVGVVSVAVPTGVAVVVGPPVGCAVTSGSRNRADPSLRVAHEQLEVTGRRVGSRK